MQLVFVSSPSDASHALDHSFGFTYPDVFRVLHLPDKPLHVVGLESVPTSQSLLEALTGQAVRIDRLVSCTHTNATDSRQRSRAPLSGSISDST